MISIGACICFCLLSAVAGIIIGVISSEITPDDEALEYRQPLDYQPSQFPRPLMQEIGRSDPIHPSPRRPRQAPGVGGEWGKIDRAATAAYQGAHVPMLVTSDEIAPGTVRMLGPGEFEALAGVDSRTIRQALGHDV